MFAYSYSGVQLLAYSGSTKTDGLGLDIANNHIYFARKDNTDSKIFRSDLDDGGNRTMILNLGTGGVGTLEVGGGKIYWATTQYIRRANLDGSAMETIISGQSSIVGIKVVPTLGRIFWTDQTSGLIQSADLDGGNIFQIASGESGSRGVAVDAATNKIYWGGFDLKRSNLDGTNVEHLTTFGTQNLTVAFLSTITPEETAELPTGTSVSQEVGGGTSSVGGVAFQFDNVGSAGTLTADYETPSSAELNDLLPEGAEALIDFQLSGSAAQVWNLNFGGEFSENVLVTFAYDETLVSGSEDDLTIRHFTGGAWQNVTEGFVLNTVANTITVQVNSFSPLLLAGIGSAVPEPSTGYLALLGLLTLGGVGWRSMRPSSCRNQ